MIKEKEQELEIGKCDYFGAFMKEVVKELKKNKDYYVFNEEQVQYIKNYFGDEKIIVDEKDNIFYLSLKN